MQTQCQKILRDLQRGSILTAAIAIKEYRCYRLAARIAELRKHYPIKSRLVHYNGRKFSAYWL